MSRLLFSKTGRAKYISHLDLMRTFQRVFQRADLTIKHTEGFNPHPFISILMPLSTGFSSQCEVLEFQLLEDIAPDEVPARLNSVMPEGIWVERCYEGGQKAKLMTYVDYCLTMEYKNNLPDGVVGAWNELLGRDSLVVIKKSKKAKSGEISVDIMPLVKLFSITEKSGVVELNARISAQNPGLNPQLILTAFNREYPEMAPDYVSYHRVAILDKDEQIFA